MATVSTPARYRDVIAANGNTVKLPEGRENSTGQTRHVVPLENLASLGGDGDIFFGFV